MMWGERAGVMFKKKGFWAGAVVFVAAAVVRGVYLYESSDNPTFCVPIVDSMTYDQLARRMAGGAGMSGDFFWQQFFYPFFLSMVYFLSHSSVVWARIVQAVLGCVTCVLTYRLGKKIFGGGVGFLAGCIAAFYGPLIFFETELLAAGLATFWGIVLILVFLKVSEQKSAWLCVVLGAVGGLSVITRPNFIPFLLAGGVWLAYVWVRGGVRRGRVMFGLMSILGGFVAITLPVAAKNYQLTRHLSFLPGTGGINLYIGNNREFEATSIRPGWSWESIVNLPSEEGTKEREEIERFFYGKVFEYVRREPLSFLGGMVRKGVEFTSSREMPGNIDIYLFGRWSRVIRLLVWKVGGFGYPFGALLALAVVGLFLYGRRVPGAVIIFIILYPGTVVLTHIEARYRMPVIVPMCVLAGAGAVGVGEMIFSGRWRAATIVGVVVIGIGWLSSVGGPFYSERYVDYEAELYYGLGDSLEKRGRAEEAVGAYSKAISSNGNYGEAHHNLGSLFLKEGKAGEAIRHYEAAVDINPGNPVLHDDLGKALQERGQVEEAIRHYNRALEIKPDFAECHNNLGIALRSQGRTAEAVEHYRRALEIKPGYVKAYNNLGVALYLQGKADEAVSCFREALRIEPDFAEARCNLGSAFQLMGRLDEAIAEYRRALEINPDYRKAGELLKAVLAKRQHQ